MSRRRRRSIGVADCDIYQTGLGGISLVGGDRKTLTPGGLVAENNHIHHYSRWKPVYRAGISLNGVGNRASHNLIHDAPHMAIGFGGNEQVIEFNEIHNVVQRLQRCGRDVLRSRLGDARARDPPQLSAPYHRL